MDDLVKRIQDTIDQPDRPNIIAMHVDDVQALLARIAKADALADALEPFAVTLERYSGFTEYALFGVWEDVNGAAGRKLNILRIANFDDAKTALAAYRESDT